ncbi:MAG: outer membrane beta-barrel protein [Bryobacteraceae bacterium]
MRTSFCCFTVLLGIYAATLAAAPQGVEGDGPLPIALSAPEPPPAPATAWVYKGFSASGYVDTYYNFNLNDPSSRISQDMALNTTSNQLSLNSATGSFQVDPAPFGFRVDVGYGRTYDAFYNSEPRHTDWAQYFLNAFVSYKVKKWKGIQFDFGKFVTSAGAEVAETYLNWNYSRSLLFEFEPLYHTGLRVTMPLTSNWTIGTQVVTGWNLVRDNNSGKTIGLTSTNTLAKGKVTIANNYYAGPENDDSNIGWRNFYDLVVAADETRRLSSYLNVDIGSNHNIDGTTSRFRGIAAAGRYRLRHALAISPRLEYYCDCDGFWTGIPQHLKEVTVTGERKLTASFIARLEWRRDWSNKPFFQNGSTPQAVDHQSMITLGLVALVRPGMFKSSPE